MAIYMKVPFASGSAKAAGYVKWVKVDSMSMSVDRSVSMETGTLKARAGGVPRFSLFTVTKAVEDASPGLFGEVVRGMSGHTVEVAVTEAGDAPKEFVRYTLTDAMVCSYDASASGDSPHERITFSYSSIELAFTPHDTTNRGNTKERVQYDMSNVG